MRTTTLHRMLKALPATELQSLATLYGVDHSQRRLDVEYALLAKDQTYIAERVLALLRKAVGRENAV